MNALELIGKRIENRQWRLLGRDINNADTEEGGLCGKKITNSEVTRARARAMLKLNRSKQICHILFISPKDRDYYETVRGFSPEE